jgi:leucine dehydrogenase
MSYPDSDSAVREAAVLAERMAGKHDLYNTGFYGAKMVINGPRRSSDLHEILGKLAEVLSLYEGSIFTGCDLNTTNADMDLVAAKAPYVLNSLTNPGVDTSQATGYGVFSAVRAVLDTEGCVEAPLITVHGLGKAGARVASEAVATGHDVRGYDLNAARVEDLEIISVDELTLFTDPCEVLVLCSISGVITEDIARKVNARWIVSASNAPLASPEAGQILADRGTRFLPDIAANAGAVICDYIEHYHPEIYLGLNQYDADRYVGRRIYSKVQQIIARADLFGTSLENSTSMELAVPAVSPRGITT